VILWSTCCPLCQDSFLHVLEHVLVRELMMMMMTFICSCRNNNQAHGSAGTAAEWAGGGDGGAGAHRSGDRMVPTPRVTPHHMQRKLAKQRRQLSLRERECCLLVLNSVTSTPQFIRQPEAAWLAYDGETASPAFAAYAEGSELSATPT
jgi:hypothetical protein